MLKIEIHCEAAELDLHLLQMGWMRRPMTGTERPIGKSPNLALPYGEPESPLKKLADEMKAGTAVFVSPKRDEELSGNSGQLAPAGNPLADELTALERLEDLKAPEAAAGSTRVRGQPSPGKRRRTKEEVAEDLAYLQTAAFAPSGETEKASISTGEVRISPEDAAQDAADEAAETAERAEGPLTLDDLRNAVMRYTDKHGVPAWVANGSDIVGCPILKVPPEKIADAISRVDYATDKGPETKMLAPDPNAPATQQPTSLFGEEALPMPPLVATKDEVRLALRRYARKYDGTEDLTKAPNNDADSRAIVAQLFGAGNKIDDTPEGYGKTLAAIEAAIRDNPYQRQVYA